MSCPNFIHAWKYECNTRHVLKYNVTREFPRVEIESGFLHANFVSIFLVFAFVNFFKTLHTLEDHCVLLLKKS